MDDEGQCGAPPGFKFSRRVFIAQRKADHVPTSTDEDGGRDGPVGETSGQEYGRPQRLALGKKAEKAGREKASGSVDALLDFFALE